MKIKQVEINNFKSIKYLDFEMGDFISLIGENSHGKSNVLKAINAFFEDKKPTLDSFYNKNLKNDLAIKIVFDKLTDAEKEIASNYLHDDNLILSWVAPTELKNDTYSIKATYYEALVNDEQKKIATKDKDKIKSILPEVNFVEAICKIESETKADEKGKTLFSKIVSLVREKKQDHDTKELIQKFNEYRGKVEDESGKVKNSLREIEGGLDGFLKVWGVKTKVNMDLPDIENFLRANVTLDIDDGVKTPAQDKGHGLQRAMIFALLRSFVLLNEEYKDEDQNIKSNIFLIEEPELYLHPQMCKETYEMLKKLSKSHQVILCTHSAHFIELEDYENIAIIKKIGERPKQKTSITQAKSDVRGESPKEIFKTIKLFNPDRNEMFFAQKIVLVEGQTEKTTFIEVLKKADIPLHRYSIIICNGKEHMLPIAKVLQAFELNYCLVHDFDDPEKAKINYERIKNNKNSILNCIQDKNLKAITNSILESHESNKKRAYDDTDRNFKLNAEIKSFCEEHGKGCYVCDNDFESETKIKDLPYDGSKSKDYASYIRIKNARIDEIKDKCPSLIKMINHSFSFTGEDQLFN